MKYHILYIIHYYVICIIKPDPLYIILTQGVIFEIFENYFGTFRVVSRGGWVTLLNFENWAYVPPYL